MTADTGQLERNLGFLEAMTLGGGTMIGAGIFILPGLAAEGAGPASSVSFLIAGFVALLAALSLAELATGMPVAGGSYHYVNRALGGVFGSIVGWGMWTGLMFASAFYMIGFGQYIVGPLPFLDGRALIVLLGVLGLFLIVGINYYGTDESSGAQNVMIGVELIIVLVYVALGVFFVDPANLKEFAPTGPTGIVATTGTVFVTYLGFEIIATVAGEIERPGKLIPLTMVLSVVSVTLLYVVIMIVSTGVVPYQELGGSLVPVSDVASISMFGGIGVAAVTFAAAVAAISSSNSSILAASRVIFAMGRDSLMSERLNVTHDRFNTPHRAIITTGAVTGGLILLGLQVGEIVALLAQVASFSFLVTYALVHVAVVVFRGADPDEYDPEFKLPRLMYPTVPILGIVTAVVVVSQMRAPVIVVGFGVIVLGVVWYAVYARDRAFEEGVADEAVEGLLDELPDFLPGSTPTETAEETYTIVVPVANPETQHGLLRLAAASARAHADEESPELVAMNVIEAEETSRRNVESDRIDHQHALLENVHEITDGMDVDVRTRSLVEPEIGEAIVRVAGEEDADQVLTGWNGTLARDDYVFGKTLDTVLSEAPCDASLAEIRSDTVGRPVALAGPGPHSPKATQRAVEFATVQETTPVLLNVQPPAPDGESDPVRRGHEAVAWVADRAGIDREEYEVKVVVDEDTESAILDAVDGFETICVGLSEKSDRSRILFGSIAERISRRETGNVVVVRGGEKEGGVPNTPGETVARQDNA